MRFRPILLAACALLVFAPALPAQRQTIADGLRKAVLRTDELRLHSMVTANTEALATLMTEDSQYIHSNAVVHTRAELIGILKTGSSKYRLLRYAEPPTVRLYGNSTAILTGIADAEIERASGDVIKRRLKVTVVYVEQEMQWKMASYQSTTVPDPS